MGVMHVCVGGRCHCVELTAPRVGGLDQYVPLDPHVTRTHGLQGRGAKARRHSDKGRRGKGEKKTEALREGNTLAAARGGAEVKGPGSSGIDAEQWGPRSPRGKHRAVVTAAYAANASSTRARPGARCTRLPVAVWERRSFAGSGRLRGETVLPGTV